MALGFFVWQENRYRPIPYTAAYPYLTPFDFHVLINFVKPFIYCLRLEPANLLSSL